jgi:mitogen-activated protein kinase organizer 1
MSVALSLVRELRNGHNESVNAVKFSFDGNYCLTCSDDRTVQLWNPHKDDPSDVLIVPRALHIKTYSGCHGYPILDLALFRDNSRFVSAGVDKAFFLCDVVTGNIIRRVTAHSDRINAIDMNDDNTVVMTGSYDQRLCVWDLRSSTREPIQSFEDFTDSVTSITHNNSAIVAGCVDGTLRTYDLRSGLLHNDKIDDPITSIRFRSDKKCVLTTCLGGIIRMFDIDSGLQLNQFTGHKHEAYKMESDFSCDDKFIIGGSENGDVYMWDLMTADIAVQTNAHKKALSSIAVHPKQLIFLTASYDRTVRCWNFS